MESERFDRMSREIAAGAPRRGVLKALGGAFAAFAITATPTSFNVEDAEAKKKRKKRKKKKKDKPQTGGCTPANGPKPFVANQVKGEKRCSCEESKAEVLHLLRDTQCAFANDPGCPGGSVCSILGKVCSTVVEPDGAKELCTVAPDATCPGGIAYIYETDGAYDCTCGCASIL